MEDVYAKAAELLSRNEPSVLATIIRLTGSGPRGQEPSSSSWKMGPTWEP